MMLFSCTFSYSRAAETVINKYKLKRWPGVEALHSFYHFEVVLERKLQGKRESHGIQVRNGNPDIINYFEEHIDRACNNDPTATKVVDNWILAFEDLGYNAAQTWNQKRMNYNVFKETKELESDLHVCEKKRSELEQQLTEAEDKLVATQDDLEIVNGYYSDMKEDLEDKIMQLKELRSKTK